MSNISSSFVQTLQEVTAARALSITYNREEVSGMTFVRGLENIASAMSTRTSRAFVPAVVPLMAYTPPSTYASTQMLGIASLGEVIEMFYIQGPTDWRDKVYATLGMRSDHNPQHSIQSDYEKPLGTDFRELIVHILGSHVTSYVGQNDEHTVITSRGCPVGVVESVSEREIVVKSRKYSLRNKPGEWGWSAKWRLQ